MAAERDALKSVVATAVAETPSTASPAAVAQVAATEVVAQDPILQNALNQEPWYQSGVGIYGTGGLLWSLGAIAIQVSRHGSVIEDYDLTVMVTAVGALVSFAGVLYRRFMPGLRPMFDWWR